MDCPSGGFDAIDDLVEDGIALFVGEDAALDFCLFAFVVGFDQREHVAVVGEEGADDGENFFLPGPSDVDGDDAYGFGETDVEGVGAIFYDDAGMFAEGPGEDAVGGVDGVDLCGTELEEAIGKTADVGAEIGTSFISDIEVEGDEGGFQFLTARETNERFGSPSATLGAGDTKRSFDIPGPLKKSTPPLFLRHKATAALLGLKGVDLFSQAALATGCGLFVDAATGGDAIENRLGFLEFFGCGSLVTGGDDGLEFLQFEPDFALAITILQATLGVLTNPLFGRQRMSHV